MFLVDGISKSGAGFPTCALSYTVATAAADILPPRLVGGATFCIATFPKLRRTSLFIYHHDISGTARPGSSAPFVPQIAKRARPLGSRPQSPANRNRRVCHMTSKWRDHDGRLRCHTGWRHFQTLSLLPVRFPSNNGASYRPSQS